MERSVSGCSVFSGRGHLDYDGDANSERSSSGDISRLQRCFQSSQRTRDLFSDWRSLFWKRRPVGVLLWANLPAFAAVVCSEILMFETSTHEVRRHRSAIFPLHIPHAVGFAFACKWEGSVAWANFLGFLAGRVYRAARDGYDVFAIKVLYLAILSFVGMVEVQLAAHLVRIKLCHSLKSVPLIDTVRDSMWYSSIVFVVSLVGESVSAVLTCITGLLQWSHFPRFWSTWWMSVVAALLTISPAVIHVLDYRPRFTTILRPWKILECILLVTCTVCVLSLLIFSLPFTVIRPLPYLLYPVLIFSIFRFNRLGWSIVVACTSYFCSWGTLHFQSSALYLMSGQPERSSPKLILQIELFMTVLGLVSTCLAGAVREKKQLTRDLHNMNQKLEDAVRRRSQELMKANSELQVSQANAESANHAKSDFLASMSHEIRTPIHGILGLTDLLFQSELSTDQLESLVSVKDCADLLLHIINSILDLAKIEAGRLEVECVPFKIRDVVSTTLRMLQVRAKERGILLLWRVDANVPLLVAGDPGKLQQCLLNLVGNALKFSHRGSVIVSIRLFPSSSEPAVPFSTPIHSKLEHEPGKEISTFSKLRSRPSSDIKVDIDEETWNVIEIQNYTRGDDDHSNLSETSDTAIVLASDSDIQNGSTQPGVEDTERRILFEVRDTGIGISKEIVEEMFNPFTQADASTSRLYGGTGLGLCIVQRFVELLKGKIWVESETGKGSTFYFVLPFQLLLAEESMTASKRSLQSYHEVLDPSLNTSAVTPPGLHKQAAVRHASEGSGRRAPLSISSVDSSPSHTTSGGQVEPSLKTRRYEMQLAHEVDGRKRSMQGREELGPSSTTENEFSVTETHRKRQKGPSSSISSENFASRNGPDPVRNESHICLECRRRNNLRSAKQSIQLSNSPPSKVDPRNPTNEFIKLVIHPPDAVSNQKSPSNASKPLRVESGPKLEPSNVKQPGNLERKEHLHILLAEDNLINQKVASRQLMRHGHTVTIVGDGLQALETLQKDHDTFDLVLMDIQMPNLDGLEASSKLREEEARQGWKRLPILGLTAHAISGYKDTCLSHGMDAYLGKPFEIKQLLNVIQDLCLKSSFT